MAKVIWYEVYKAVPNMFDGDMEITRFQSTTDEKEAFDLVNDDRNTIKRFSVERTSTYSPYDGEQNHDRNA